MRPSGRESENSKSSARRIQRWPTAFTLSELLVVLVLISGMLALFAPLLLRARSAARRIQCGNNLKQLGLAFTNYQQQYNGVLPPASQGQSTSGRAPTITPWAVLLLPYLEANSLYASFDPRLGVMYEVGNSDSSPNSRGVSAMLGVMQCTAAPRAAVYNGTAPADTWPGVGVTRWETATSSYSVTSGVRGEFARLVYGQPTGDLAGALRSIFRHDGRVVSSQRPLRMQDITDGASCTSLLGERTGGLEIYDGRNVWQAPPAIKLPLAASNGGGWGDPLAGEHWLAGSPREGLPVPPTEGPCGINCTNLRNHGFHCFHAKICQFLLADGSVQLYLQDVDPAVLAALITARQGELIETTPLHPSQAGQR